MLVVGLPQFVLCAAVVFASVRLLRGKDLGLFQGCLAGMLVVAVFYAYIYVERLGEVPDDLPSYAEQKVRETFSGIIIYSFLFAALAITALCLAGGARSKAFLGKSAS